ncbi:MAG: hypothetical protein LAO20_09785 [Acidobacteriia bacterium]|nr:hypothetical protein [Terriglobia bacterium]
MISAQQHTLPQTLHNALPRRADAARRLAGVSLINGSAPASERTTALHLAQNAGVTTTDLLRTRLLMQASIPPDEMPSESADEIWLLGLS